MYGEFDTYIELWLHEQWSKACFFFAMRCLYVADFFGHNGCWALFDLCIVFGNCFRDISGCIKLTDAEIRMIDEMDDE